VNQNPSSRPFLRLFSALQSTVQPSGESNKAPGKSASGELASGKTPCDPSVSCETATGLAGQVHASTCDTHHDTKRQSKPLHSEDKMIAGSVGPRKVQSGLTAPRRVEVSLAEIAPVLADAINHQRGWLSDFSDDTVSIDADLYEVLLAYQQMRRLNAA